MRRLLKWLDEIAQVNHENKLAAWLERISFVFLDVDDFIRAAFDCRVANSMARWNVVWIIRLFVKPRPRLFRTALDVPLWAFFGWSLIYLDFFLRARYFDNKLRGAALFLIFYFVINNLRISAPSVFWHSR